ncbi:DUF2961 domain-containing protein [Mucilaginibacter sp. RB4R14]|uniref:DUF2961 domain-containing protein n=1 Tax=Mucilaginibacter aurantiaciroseus TaxID=2949308 RepID=UPI0020907F1B|nr:DUF2961 domain-containing protein [Mucilaginibacter aurantiaciroseus]MCO5935449.1 DUF2961 domain-containing protein [Mucilaginibacter aurantiaciroseus]
MKKLLLLAVVLCAITHAQQKFNGLDAGMGNIYRTSDAVSRSISPENFNGEGAIQHIWMTPTGNWRNSIIRFYWDDEATPSVESPLRMSWK